MDPITIISAIGTVADTVGKIMGIFGKKPKPSDPVKELKPYLLEILKQMQAIQQLNIQILTLVSQLPSVIRVIVHDELKAHDLEEAYREMQTFIDLFDAMGSDAQFDVVTSASFIAMTDNISLIFNMEPEIGALGKMLRCVEFSDIATKQQPKFRKFLRFTLDSRLIRLQDAKSVQTAIFTKQVELLNNALLSPYIISSNADVVTSTYELNFIGAPDKMRTEVYYTSERREIEGGIECCRRRYEVIQVPHEREVLDSSFSALRDDVLKNLLTMKKSLNITESAIAALQDDISTLEWYTSAILTDDDKSVVIESFLFEPSDHEKGLAPNAPFYTLATNCYSQ